MKKKYARDEEQDGRTEKKRRNYRYLVNTALYGQRRVVADVAL